MARKLHNILVTGGAGFIGSNFIHYMFGKSTSGAKAFEDANFSGRIVNVDALTYAGNGESLDDVDAEFGSGVKGETGNYDQIYFKAPCPLHHHRFRSPRHSLFQDAGEYCRALRVPFCTDRTRLPRY